MTPFSTVAEAFCVWAEGPAGDELWEALTARRLLARAYVAALDLPPSGPESEAEGPGALSREAIYRRFGALPFNYYSEADPLIVPASDTMTGDLADDLADVWSELKVGLLLHQAGKTHEAAHEWRWRFDAHWGQHAVSALHALHSWLAAHGHEGATAQQ
jgi:hypothetical protein